MSTAKDMKLLERLMGAIRAVISERDDAVSSAERYRQWGSRPHGRAKTGRHLPRIEFEHVTDSDWSEASCYYWLVIPLKAHDIRREGPNGEDLYQEWFIPVGRTIRRGGNPDRQPVHNGIVESPFRDGAHARFDREALGLPNLPIWAVCGEESSEIETKQ